MRTEEMKAVESAHESGVFPKRPVSIVRGHGARLFDAEGREYLDFGANYGVMNVGHCNPHVVEAVQRQMERLTFIAQTYYNDERARFLQLLARSAPAGLTRAFLCNSGTEAIEAAMKFARGVTGRKRFVAGKKAFHGRTFGALSLTFKPEYREPFQPLVEGVTHVAYGDEEALKQAVTRETAAVVLEPIQGEGGVIVPPPGYLKAAREITRDAGALLVMDEIQTGLARTGRMWACEHESVTPDILAFAKSIAGGLPMGGILMTEDVARLPPASHGNTFGGGPVACAAACATLEFIEGERLWENAAARGEQLLRGLAAIRHPAIREVRGRGLMIGLELKVKNAPVLNGLVNEGVLCLPTGATVIRYLPPLTVTPSEVDRAIAATEKALTNAVPG